MSWLRDILGLGLRDWACYVCGGKDPECRYRGYETCHWCGGDAVHRRCPVHED